MMNTFEDYVVGKANELAHAAAMACADGSAKTPFYIYGKSGLGKTHLLKAVAHEIQRRDAACRVVFIQGEQLVLEAIQAVRVGAIGKYWDTYWAADVILVDDVQFLGRRDAIQESFAAILQGKNVILTADRLPENLPGFGEALKNYFETCFRVEIQPPDYDTRVAIIKSIAAREDVELAEEIISYVAENVTDNVRVVRGVMNKLLAYRDLLGADMDNKNLPN